MKTYSIYIYKEEGGHIDNNGDEWLKVGDTTGDAKKRVKQQTTASNRKELDILYEEKTTFRDYKVHKRLRKLGIKKQKEWFHTNVSQIKKVIHGIKYGIPRENTYKMRNEQQDAVDMAYNYYNEDPSNKVFLWNAKMRFGKTFAAYQLMKKLKAHKVLVVTYKPVVVDEWEDELNNHIDFEGYDFVKAIDNKTNIRLSNASILFVSFQDLLQDYEYDEENVTKELGFKINKEKFATLPENKFDLVIVDEVHFGATNIPAKRLLDEVINHDKVLYLSGTPFKLLNDGELSDEQIYTWTYIDEQNRKNALTKQGVPNDDNVYWSLPKMSIIGYSLGDSVFEDLKYFDEEEYFSFAKFFKSEDGKSFINGQEVKHFIDVLANKKSEVSPFFLKDIPEGPLNHTFWLLPGVNAAKALCHMLRKHAFFRDYTIVCASDDNLGEGKDTLGLVKSAINEKNSKGSITLSCGKLTTVVTVKEWG